MNFAEMFQQKRLELGLEIEDVARKTGMTEKTLNRLVQGLEPMDKTVVRLADFLGIPLEDVFTEEKVMTAGKWVRLNRRRKGMTVEGCAVKAKITSACLRQIERDAHACSIFTAIQLADAMGIGIDEMIGRRVKE